MPAAVLPGVPMPVVLAFHGYTGGAYDLEYVGGLSELSDAKGFLAVYPAGTGDPTQWDLPGDVDVAFVTDLLAELEARVCIDLRRVFATGFSMGGGLANVLGCRLADRISAIAPVAALHGESWEGECLPSRPVPIVAFHGTADVFNPYEGGELGASEFAGRPASPVEPWMAGWAAANGCGSEPTVTVVADDVDLLAWTGCQAATELYRVTDGGHTWPGGINDPTFGYATESISASALLWAFFERQP
jgi:polyhydroxybutyrate depolymerase